MHVHRSSFRSTLASACILLISLIALSSRSGAQTCCQPAGSNLIAWWSPDDSQGSTVAEHTGLHTGTFVGAPTPAPGLVLGALAFDGLDDYVSVPDDPAWTFPGNFTIDLWAKWE